MADRNPERNITIVGAGLVGSLLAVLLRKRGFEVSMFEKRADIRKQASAGDRSINLVITSRGLNGLEKAGLLQQALELSVPIVGRMVHPKYGDLAFQPYGNSDECNFSISRSRLNQFLLESAEAAGVKIHFNHDIEAIDFEKREMIFDVRGKKKRIVYDLLLGTDGAGSQVRKQLCAKFPSEFSEVTEWLASDYKELYMPAGSGGQYRLEKNALHVWPRGRNMMMALANLDGSFTMTLYMPREQFAILKSQTAIQSLFDGEFADAVPLMPNFAHDFLAHPQGRLGTVRTSKWVYKDSVALLGDAAHAIVPFIGQGMNAGFEDCTELMKLIEVGGEWLDILAQYERIQKPNANAIADIAIENSYELSEKVGDPQFLLRKKIEVLLEQKFPQYFKSRYAMVTYTLNPYSLAQAAGLIQSRVLDELCKGISRPEDVSLTEAEKLLSGELAAFNKKHKMSLTTDPLVANARKLTN